MGGEALKRCLGRRPPDAGASMYRKCLIVFLSLFLLVLSKLAASYSQTTTVAHSDTPQCASKGVPERSVFQCAAP